jgi:signal transduction histidine kinase
LRHFRLQTRFIVYFTLLVVGLMIPVVVLVESRMGDVLEHLAEQRSLSIARNLAAVSQTSLVTYNYVALTQSAERAKRDEEGITDVIILNKEGRVAAFSGHPERQGTVLTDPVSQQAAASRVDLAIPADIPREDSPGSYERGLDVSVPVFVENSEEKWGTVRIRFSTEDMRRRIRDTRLVLLGVGLLAVGLGAVGSFFLARRVTEPLSNLVAGTIRAAAGDFDTRIEIRTGDEIEELAGTFNDMVAQVRANEVAIHDLNRDLEEKVRERTQALSSANESLMKAYAGLQRAESQMILREKMASLGQLVAGIAHEINTPSSAIAAAVANMIADLEGLPGQTRALVATGVPPTFESRLYDLAARVLTPDLRVRRASTSEIRERSRALEERLTAEGFERPRDTAITFARLGLQAELAELASAAGGHAEAARPAIAFLHTLGNLGLAVSDMSVSTDAITRMVKALRSYSHPDQADMAEADIHDGIETTLTILRNQTKYGVVVERRYSRLPPVLCNVNELNQVWTNVIHNAIQAMNGMGRIIVETYRQDECVAVRITDNGPGIPDAIRGRIFDPFFTTKDQGEGTGLGLGIALQIVTRHEGRINVTSEPGRTSFEVVLPLRLVAATATT